MWRYRDTGLCVGFVRSFVRSFRSQSVTQPLSHSATQPLSHSVTQSLSQLPALSFTASLSAPTKLLGADSEDMIS